ncbi:5'(3')-deoxyribonucleotidase, cytosolic type-like [Mytilus galloprovincialis]|uniref:5'(3')-deoxyribonucleotidase, cytosolic type-like n=1 Tax=Mytilus galloprovincialis TaxID=29158 RepID=UPI003F7C319F
MAARRGIGSMAQRTLMVLIDLDETLAAFEKHFVIKFREKYPNEPYIPVEKRNTFYIAEQYDKLNFTDDSVRLELKKIYRSEHFFRDLPEIEGGCDAVKEMAEMEGVEVFICSSPLFQYKYSAPEKYEWVEKHLGPDWINRLILTRDKTMINGDILIDDKIHITGALHNPSWKHVVFTAPNNQNMKVKGDKLRLNNWTDGTWRTMIEDFKKRL